MSEDARGFHREMEREERFPFRILAWSGCLLDGWPNLWVTCSRNFTKLCQLVVVMSKEGREPRMEYFERGWRNEGAGGAE